MFRCHEPASEETYPVYQAELPFCLVISSHFPARCNAVCGLPLVFRREEESSVAALMLAALEDSDSSCFCTLRTVLHHCSIMGQPSHPSDPSVGLGLLPPPSPVLGNSAASVHHVSCSVSSGIGTRPRRVQQLWRLPLTLQYLIFVLHWCRYCCCTTGTEWGRLPSQIAYSPEQEGFTGCLSQMVCGRLGCRVQSS